MTTYRFGLSAAVLACALGLSACGGGGGGGSEAPSANPQPAAGGTLGITASNYQAVGQAAVSSALYLSETGGTLTGAQTGSPRLLRNAVDASRRALGELGRRQAVLTGVETRETLPCSQGGNLVLSLNDAGNNGELDAGDSVTIDAQSCKEDGSLTQGRITLTLQTLTGVFGSNNYSVTMSMALAGFSSTTGNETSQGEGTILLSLSETPAGVADVSLTVNRLVTSSRIAGQMVTITLTDTRLTMRTEAVGGARRASISYDGSLASNVLGDKALKISTPQPLVVLGNDAYPSSGQMVVRGEGNSAVRVTAINATQVRFELDAGGDGVYETQVVKNWTDLQ